MFLFARFARLVTPLVLIGALVPVDARAQTIPFAELSGRVKPGDNVSITGTDGRRTTGRIAQLTTDSLLVVTDAGSRTFPDAAVRRIVVKDSLINGAVIGLVAGAVAGAVVDSWLRAALCEGACTGTQDIVIIVGLMGGGGGAAIGAGIDGLFHRRINVSRPQGASFTVSPAIGPDRQAVLASVRF